MVYFLDRHLSKIWFVLIFLLPATALADEGANGEVEAPQGPVELRFTIDDPLRYQVETRTQISYDERPDFEPHHHSSMTVEYRPITDTERDLMPRWNVDVAESSPTVRTGISVLASIADFKSDFEQPTVMTEAAIHHQVLKNGAFSFRLTPRGEIGDIQIHPPTNPIARGSIEEMIRLLAASHPALPEEAVQPGDSWSESLELAVEDDYVETEQQGSLDYEFRRWAPCDGSICALIEVESAIDATGAFRARTLHTDTTSNARGRGQILLHVEAGRIVESNWSFEINGTTKTDRSDHGHTERVVDLDFRIDVSTEFVLVDP